MESIRPISDVYKKFSEIDHIVTEEQNPVILTKNGYGHMVVLSFNEYSRLVSRNDLYKLIDEALEAEANGKVHEYGKVISELRAGMKNGRI